MSIAHLLRPVSGTGLAPAPQPQPQPEPEPPVPSPTETQPAGSQATTATTPSLARILAGGDDREEATPTPAPRNRPTRLELLEREYDARGEPPPPGQPRFSPSQDSQAAGPSQTSAGAGPSSQADDEAPKDGDRRPHAGGEPWEQDIFHGGQWHPIEYRDGREWRFPTDFPAGGSYHEIRAMLDTLTEWANAAPREVRQLLEAQSLLQHLQRETGVLHNNVAWLQSRRINLEHIWNEVLEMQRSAQEDPAEAELMEADQLQGGYEVTADSEMADFEEEAERALAREEEERVSTP